MTKIKKISLIIGGAFVLIAVILCAVQMLVAPYIYDAKLASVLSLIEKKVPGLKLEYEETASNLITREGEISWSLPLPPENIFLMEEVSGKVNLKTVFGPISVKGEFNSISGGSIDSIFSNNPKMPFTYKGAYEFSALLLKAQAGVKSGNFMVQLPDGKCVVGESSLYSKLKSLSSANIDLALAGIHCQGDEEFSSEKSYLINLEGFSLKTEPTYIDNRLGVNKINVGLNKFTADISTVYALGFKPETQVHDPTLREYFSVSRLGALLEVKDPDAQGLSEIVSDGSADFNFAFPYVKEDTRKEVTRLTDFRYAFSLEKVNLPLLVKALNVPEEDFFKTVSSAIADNVSFSVQNLSCNYKQDGFSVTGFIKAKLDKASLKVDDVNAMFDVKGGKEFVDFLLREDQRPLLEESLQEGKITYKAPFYITKFVLQDKKATLNGIAFKAEDDDED